MDRAAEELRNVRRLAGILLADVKGYGLAMGRDEAGTLRALKDARATLRFFVAEFNPTSPTEGVG